MDHLLQQEIAPDSAADSAAPRPGSARANKPKKEQEEEIDEAMAFFLT